MVKFNYLPTFSFHHFTISPFHHFTISPFHHFTISPFHHFTICLIFATTFHQGCLNIRAEIIPSEPDPDNAGVGTRVSHYSLPLLKVISLKLLNVPI